MKKFFLTILCLFAITLSSTACTNSSMEDGFDKLDKALQELGAAIEALNISQMEADLAQMNEDVAQMIVDLESQQGVWEDAISQISQISDALQIMLEDSENWATTDQMQELHSQVQEFGEGIDLLVLAADYDHDGVLNVNDKCPNTPLNEINNVNAQGCAPGE